MTLTNAVVRIAATKLIVKVWNAFKQAIFVRINVEIFKFPLVVEVTFASENENLSCNCWNFKACHTFAGWNFLDFRQLWWFSVSKQNLVIEISGCLLTRLSRNLMQSRFGFELWWVPKDLRLCIWRNLILIFHLVRLSINSIVFCLCMSSQSKCLKENHWKR